MSDILELAKVQISPAGERRTPDPNEEQLKVYHGTHELPTSIEIHRDNITAPATPEHLLIGNLNHPRLRLREPITIIITREDSLLIASIPEIEEFGFGSHLTAAVEDLRQTLVELYLTLKAEQDHLGPDMIHLWNQLLEIIEER